MVLLPGFIQWDAVKLEDFFSIPIRKGTEFASDLPLILEKLKKGEIDLSTSLPADKLIHQSGINQYQEIYNENYEKATKNLGFHSFYINKMKSEVMIAKDLPPPIIAEIVNCPEKSDNSILRKVKHYIDSGAQIIDIGCVANKPNPERLKNIINLIQSNFDILISVDSMIPEEIKAAVEAEIDMILSLDFGNYKELLSIPHDIPIVILPTNIKKGFFPKNPEKRINRLLELTEKLRLEGFKKIIVDPLLETPISPGITNSMESYFLYKKKIASGNYNQLESPMFFGVSNVVELMDVDSVGINGLLAALAIELDIGIVFTVEHSAKMFGGVRELSKSLKLNYLAKYKNTPPINVGIQLFKAKGKTSQNIPHIPSKKLHYVDGIKSHYKADKAGYFKIYVDQYEKLIIVFFYSNQDKLLTALSGVDSEIISKRIIDLKLTTNPYHVNYLGRELKKAELYLKMGKPYIQDE